MQAQLQRRKEIKTSICRVLVRRFLRHSRDVYIRCFFVANKNEPRDANDILQPSLSLRVMSFSGNRLRWSSGVFFPRRYPAEERSSTNAGYSQLLTASTGEGVRTLALSKKCVVRMWRQGFSCESRRNDTLPHASTMLVQTETGKGKNWTNQDPWVLKREPSL